MNPEEFFEVIEENPCENCILYKKKYSLGLQETIFKYKKGFPEIVVILDDTPLENSLYLHLLHKLNLYFSNFWVLSGLKCQIKSNVTFPSPVYEAYKECNCINKETIDWSKTKAIIPFGKSLNAITQTSDLINWLEFAEYNFNQTYFYTGFNWEYQIRCYPVPELSAIIDKDNFDSYFFIKQIQFVKNFIAEYSVERTGRYRKIKIEENQVNIFIEKHLNEPIVSWDLETNSLDPFSETLEIGCLTLSFDGVTGYYLPFKNIDFKLLQKFLNYSENTVRLGAFLKYDINCLHTIGIDNIYFNEEVTLAHHLTSTERVSNSIKALSWLLPGLGGYDSVLEDFKKNNKISSYLEIPENILFEYSVLDAIVAFRLYENSLELFEKQPKIREGYKTAVEVIPAICEMERNGFNVDKQKFIELEKYFQEELNKIQKEFDKSLGYSINLNSDEQVAKAFEQLKFPCYGRSTKKTYTLENGTEKYFYKVSQLELKKWKKDGFELAELMLEYRKFNKIKNTFVGKTDSFLEELKAKNLEYFSNSTEQESNFTLSGLAKKVKSYNKIHPFINVAGTVSYRSSSDLHNIPKNGVLATKLREFFILPSNDFYFMDFDYSGFQVRIAGNYSLDENLIEAFKSKIGGDVHSMMGHEIFCSDEMTLEQFMKLKKQEPYSDYRVTGKRTVFGYIFGTTASTFRDKIYEEWPYEKVKEYIFKRSLEILENPKTKEYDEYYTVAHDIRNNKFFAKFPRLLEYFDRQHNFAKKNGYVESFNGIRRHLIQLTKLGKNSNFFYTSNFLNAAVNNPIQQEEAYWVLKAITKIYKQMKFFNLKSKLLFTTHDSISFYVEKSEILKLFKICKEAMEIFNYTIPYTASCTLGKELWGFGKEFETLEEISKYLIDNKIEQII